MKNSTSYFVLFFLIIFGNKLLFPQWVRTNGPNSSVVNSLTIHVLNGDTILFAGTSTGVFRTSDKGETWDSLNTGLTDPSTNKIVRALLSLDTNLYAGTHGGVLRYNNSQEMWVPKNTGLTMPSDKIVRALISKDSTIFAGTSSGIFHSTNNGESWLKSYSDHPVDIQAMAVVDTDFFASEGLSKDTPGIFLSTDNGKSWASIYSTEGGRSGQFYTSLAVLNTFLIAGSVNGEHFGVAFLYDNGERWVGYKTSLYPRDVYSITEYNEKIFAATDSGVYYSSNYGDSWSNIGLSESVSSLIIFGNYIYAGTMVGIIWKRPVSEIITSIDKERNNFPEHFNLEQNFPNPFNPVTTISYQIPKYGMVTIKIYDILGREIKTLVNEYKPVGRYNITFNASNLASGVYFYRFQAEEFTETKKLLLLK
jgi:photosystem II stability/assembly factor-like uncharacterized protein